MTATMNGEPYTIEGGVVSGTGTAVSMGENILTITNEHQNGVDYYHSSKGHYPVDAGDLATLTPVSYTHLGTGLISRFRWFYYNIFLRKSLLTKVIKFHI